MIIQSEKLIPFVRVFVETHKTELAGMHSYEAKYLPVRRYPLDGVSYCVVTEENVRREVIELLVRTSGVSPAPEQKVYKKKNQKII
ncbi:hypothetical protein OGV87_10245 [Citrobacter sp. CK183]|uniref:hypothetical protein n=1 Tax=Citrobacter sp. CK183 TaxID=2985092 RepID=UPI002577476B|nr:hypothetical protein [Citrobacter sp. CK183]MDM3050974.1 hypothetical protein [Citrobacter sp. CK183]